MSRHESRTDDECQEEAQDFDIEITVSPTDHDDCIHMIYERCIANGLPELWQPRLKQLLERFANVFRTKVGNDPAARLTPCVTEQKPQSTPYFSKARLYQGKEMNEWRRNFIAEPSVLGAQAQRRISTSH